MDLTTLIQKWTARGQTLHPFPASALTHPRLSAANRTYLLTAGLPTDAAPFLNFLPAPDALQTPNQYFRIDFEGLDDYLVIGSNGSGDPICIDLTSDNEVVYLNHDDNFKQIFMNATVEQLSHCLLRYKSFIVSLINPADPNDFSVRKFADAELNDVRTFFTIVDPKALTAGGFWETELDALVWERENLS